MGTLSRPRQSGRAREDKAPAPRYWEAGLNGEAGMALDPHASARLPTFSAVFTSVEFPRGISFGCLAQPCPRERWRVEEESAEVIQIDC